MLKKWQKNVMALVKKLGWTDKMQKGILTADEQKQLSAEYEKEYGISLQADKEANEDAEPDPDPLALSAEDQKELAALLGTNQPPVNKDEAVNKLTGKVNEQQKTIDKLTEQPEPVKPVEKVSAPEVVNSQHLSKVLGLAPHSETHLFGIDHPMFLTNEWYNQLMISGSCHESEADITQEQADSFKKAVTTLSKSLRERVNYLKKNNQLGQLDFEKLISGNGAIDYSDMFEKAGEYITARTDLILAYMRTLPTVDHIFPTVSGVQNKQRVPGAHFGELSQGYRKGKIWKGRANFTIELYKVDDLMFKFLFEDLIDLEKQYIGYLNREGSDVIKWTFIEWIMVHFGQILNSERNQRRILGYRVPQQNVQENPALLGGDGVVRAVERVIEQYKVLPFFDMKAYAPETILDYYENLYDRVEQILDSMEGVRFYGNAKHKRAYIRQFREKYGKDNDFTGVKEGLIDISPENIIWMPNMRAYDCWTWITFPGNIESYEDRPHEMLMYYFERDWESIGVMSRWKEGAGLRQAGVQYKSLQELEESNFKHQYIFVNFPVTTLAADQKIIDGKKNVLFLTEANTQATAITDIQKAETDRVYKIICGSENNATTIKKAGKFSKISADWVPVKFGDYIKVYAELEDVQETNQETGETYNVTKPTGKFLELERRVS